MVHESILMAHKTNLHLATYFIAVPQAIMGVAAPAKS